MGYLMRHHLRTEGGSSVSQRIITQFVKVKQELFNRLFTFFPIWTIELLTTVLHYIGSDFLQIMQC